MKPVPPEKFRVTLDRHVRCNAPIEMATNSSYGMNGLFVVPPSSQFPELRCIVSDTGWEHVSVTVSHTAVKRCPTWDEMCRVKDLFWNEDEDVVQFHPAKSRHVNYHPFCLHLWRPIGQQLPLPPMSMVGPKS